MSDMTEDEIRRAEQARYLLDHDLMKAAFAEVGDEIARQWRESPARDTEGRERLYLMLRLLDRVRDTLQGHVETGKVARARLADLERERTISNLFGLVS